MNKPRFRIGEWVMCTAVANVIRTDVSIEQGREDIKKGIIVFEKEIFEAQVVGLKRIFNGVLKCDFCYVDEDGCDVNTRPYMDTESSTLLWEVKTGYLNKPFLIPDDHIYKAFPNPNLTTIMFIMADKAYHKHMPMLKQTRALYSDEDKNHLRESVKNVPRDTKGRWIK